MVHHQSVTRAAEHLGVTQPAVSAALARLRRHFDDETLHRVGNRYQLTPFGVDLRQRARIALTGVERVFAARGTFEATDTAREYSIFTSDYTTALLGRPLTELLGIRAPRARLRWLPSIPDLVARRAHAHRPRCAARPPRIRHRSAERDDLPRRLGRGHRSRTRPARTHHRRPS
ncbi:LysR family transcriptional regulator [Nocardia noduli]|uniref:LysR family transcriptional regulator n=1 Tax=Nocardia noduli TaxID=2815722 RepID=UPI003F6860DE